MKSILSAFIIFLVTLNSFSQDPDTLTPKQIRDFKDEMAKKQILELKEGVLLVQLKTRQKTIDAYTKKGLDKKANEVKSLQLKDNLNIIKGFNKYFNFCPVYFYTSNDFKKVKAKNFTEVTFYDSLMQPKTIVLDLNNTDYYICEISKNNYNNSTLTNIPNYKLNYDRSIKFDAFIIKNNEFLQLSSPFPYYAKTHIAIKVKDKKRWESIKKLNYRLHFFYENNK